MAKDIIKDIYEKEPFGNDSLFLVNFHIYHFISLVKTLGDNLAWILNYFYEMNLGKFYVDLTKKRFRDLLESKNKDIYDEIYKHEQFSDFENLKEYRHIIQHRHAIHVVNLMVGIDGPRSIMIPLHPELGVTESLRSDKREIVKQYANISSKESIAKYGLKRLVIWIDRPENMPYIDPISFCQMYIDFLSDILNKTFEKLISEMED